MIKTAQFTEKAYDSSKNWVNKTAVSNADYHEANKLKKIHADKC